MDIHVAWFCVIAFFWTGYLILEGFDFGVGMLLPILDKDADGTPQDTRRRVMINTIAPVWDGNEVWLLVAGGATFAAFPGWYATYFSGFYLPVLIILIALILRALAFEYRGKINDETWRKRWDWAIIGGSTVTPFVWGVVFSANLSGVPLNDTWQWTGSPTASIGPYAILGGLAFVFLFATHGAVFLALKTDGPIRGDCAKLARTLATFCVAIVGTWALWTQIAHGKTWTWAITAIALLCLVCLLWWTRRQAEGKAFTATTITTAAAIALIFSSLWPNVVPATDPQFSLTAADAAATAYTLKIMTWVAGGITPVVMAYQGWTYWVFRKRITTTVIPDHAGLTTNTTTAL